VGRNYQTAIGGSRRNRSAGVRSRVGAEAPPAERQNGALPVESAMRRLNGSSCKEERDPGSVLGRSIRTANAGCRAWSQSRKISSRRISSQQVGRTRGEPTPSFENPCNRPRRNSDFSGQWNGTVGRMATVDPTWTNGIDGEHAGNRASTRTLPQRRTVLCIAARTITLRGRR